MHILSLASRTLSRSESSRYGAVRVVNIGSYRSRCCAEQVGNIEANPCGFLGAQIVLARGASCKRRSAGPNTLAHIFCRSWTENFTMLRKSCQGITSRDPTQRSRTRTHILPRSLLAQRSCKKSSQGSPAMVFHRDVLQCSWTDFPPFDNQNSHCATVRATRPGFTFDVQRVRHATARALRPAQRVRFRRPKFAPSVCRGFTNEPFRNSRGTLARAHLCKTPASCQLFLRACAVDMRMNISQ